MARILFLTERDQLPGLAGRTQGEDMALGFWLAEDSPSDSLKRAKAVHLNQIAERYPFWVKKAYALAHALAANSPPYRGIQPLLAWEGYLADALLLHLIIGDFHQHLLDRCGTGREVVFLAGGETEKSFSMINAWRGSPFKISCPGGAREEGPAAGWRRRWRACRDLVGDARRERHWERAAWRLLENLDQRYTIRSAFRPAVQVPKGGRWFYSSYTNFTKILKCHLDGLSGETAWVVNQYSPRQGLPPDARWHYLWQFGGRASSQEKRQFLHVFQGYLRTVPREVEGFPLRVFLAGSGAVQYLFQRLLPFSLAEADLMEAFLDRSAAHEIWVADQWGSEGQLISLAGQKGIPVTQVQHGILHRWFAAAPVYADKFLVWGRFWQEVLGEPAKTKIEIFNPGLKALPSRRNGDHSGRKTVTFLTSPPHLGLLWNVEAMLDEIAALAQDLLQEGYAVLIRVHPSDRPEFWRQCLEEKRGFLPGQIRFSGEEPLEWVLQETDVAVMFFSTVFLNCLASGIPVIGLGWYPHIWQSHLRKAGIIRMARSMGEALKLVKSAGRPEAAPSLADFLAPPSRSRTGFPLMARTESTPRAREATPS